MTDTFTSIFRELLPILIKNLQDTMNPLSNELLNTLTMQQFQSLGKLGVEESLTLCADLEDIFREYKNCLETEMKLKQNRCLLFKKINRLNENVSSHAAKLKERSEQLMRNDTSFLCSSSEKKIIKESDLNEDLIKKDEPCPEEPVYSTRNMKDSSNLLREKQFENQIQEPQYSSSYKLQQSTRKEFHRYSTSNLEKSKGFCSNLDQSILDGATDITINEDRIPGRLQFDVDDDEDEKEQVYLKPLLRSEKDSSQDSTRLFATRNTFDEVPRPPVFTSIFGRQLNKN